MHGGGCVLSAVASLCFFLCLFRCFPALSRLRRRRSAFAVARAASQAVSELSVRSVHPPKANSRYGKRPRRLSGTRERFSAHFAGRIRWERPFLTVSRTRNPLRVSAYYIKSGGLRQGAKVKKIGGLGMANDAPSKPPSSRGPAGPSQRASSSSRTLRGTSAKSLGSIE